ncbi:MAG TPA: tetratricopeptide repeat protein [Bryobacteraceae bacterium]|nr:tetratricopeptide repeat protein [Bryobacteraceae bacterium]
MRSGRRQPRDHDRRSQRASPTTPHQPRVRIAAWPWAAAWPWPAVFAAVVAAYWPALRGGLLWDDAAHVTPPALQSLDGLWRIWFSLGATQQYYPLLHSAFWLEHRLWGDAVLGYHLANLAEHALAACLVVLIVRRLALPGAWLAGLIFALHPVSVEAVAWISEQKSTLSAVFFLSSALVYLGFDRTRCRSSYFWALGLFVLALLSKTVTATLPAALLVIFWWQRGRLDWRRDVRPLVPWFALGASAGLFTAWVERTFIGAQGAEFRLTPIQRLLVAARAVCFYAGKLIWPVNLTFSYPRWTIDPAVWWQYLYPLAILALAVALAIVARRRRGPLAVLLLFAGTLFPALGFLNAFPFVYSFVADHFQYLASLALIVPFCVVVQKLRIPQPRAAGPLLAAALLLVLGALTWRQSGMYRNVETLWRTTLARNPESWMAHNNLGLALAEMPGRLPEAMAEYQAALRLKPDSAEAHNNLGSALSQIGRLADAVSEFQAALRIEADYSEARNNLGLVLAQMPGHAADAIAEQQAAVRLKPNEPRVHIALAHTLLLFPGRTADAIAELQAALRLEPANAEAHNDLGRALAQLSKLPDALAEFETAVRLKPDFAEAHNNLGTALAQTPGRAADGMAEFQTALRIRPDFADAHNNLGLALMQMPGRAADALAEFQAALRAQPDYAPAHRSLGDALAMSGRMPEAVNEFRAAVRILPNDPEAHSILGMALSRIPGRLPQAIAEYQTALRLQPDYLQARINLADALAAIPGRRADAIAQYTAVLRVRPDLETVRQSIERLRAKQR